MTNCIAGIAIVAAFLGRLTVAVRLVASAGAARESIGNPVPRPNQKDLNQTIDRSRSEVGERRFAAAWDAGRNMSLDEAFAEATVLRLDPSTCEQSANLLSLREREVLQLMAKGKSDREISDALFISYRTTTTHVSNIFNKLGVNSRTAASTDAVRLGLI
ncbi:hypothetical protein BH23CHL5_BH23CHL5_21110 [soil metagenome]